MGAWGVWNTYGRESYSPAICLRQSPRYSTLEGQPELTPCRWPRRAVEALLAHRRRQAEQRLMYSELWRDEDLIFPSKTGSPMNWNNLVGRNLKPLMRAAGLAKGTRPYDLRHTFATLMLENAS